MTSTKRLVLPSSELIRRDFSWRNAWRVSLKPPKDWASSFRWCRTMVLTFGSGTAYAAGRLSCWWTEKDWFATAISARVPIRKPKRRSPGCSPREVDRHAFVSDHALEKEKY